MPPNSCCLSLRSLPSSPVTWPCSHSHPPPDHTQNRFYLLFPGRSMHSLPIEPSFLLSFSGSVGCDIIILCILENTSKCSVLSLQGRMHPLLYMNCTHPGPSAFSSFNNTAWTLWGGVVGVSPVVWRVYKIWWWWDDIFHWNENVSRSMASKNE